jgi:hypothetical protein
MSATRRQHRPLTQGPASPQHQKPVPAPRGLSNAEVARRIKDNRSSGEAADAAQAKASPGIPFAAQVSALLGADLSGIQSAVGVDDQLNALGANAAMTDQTLLFRDGPSLETVLHETIHWLQGGGGAQGSVSQPGHAAESEARALAQQGALGKPVGAPAAQRQAAVSFEELSMSDAGSSYEPEAPALTEDEQQHCESLYDQQAENQEVLDKGYDDPYSGWLDEYHDVSEDSELLTKEKQDLEAERARAESGLRALKNGTCIDPDEWQSSAEHDDGIRGIDRRLADVQEEAFNTENDPALYAAERDDLLQEYELVDFDNVHAEIQEHIAEDDFVAADRAYTAWSDQVAHYSPEELAILEAMATGMDDAATKASSRSESLSADEERLRRELEAAKDLRHAQQWKQPCGDEVALQKTVDDNKERLDNLNPHVKDADELLACWEDLDGTGATCDGEEQKFVEEYKRAQAADDRASKQIQEDCDGYAPVVIPSELDEEQEWELEVDERDEELEGDEQQTPKSSSVDRSDKEGPRVTHVEGDSPEFEGSGGGTTGDGWSQGVAERSGVSGSQGSQGSQGSSDREQSGGWSDHETDANEVYVVVDEERRQAELHAAHGALVGRIEYILECDLGPEEAADVTQGEISALAWDLLNERQGHTTVDDIDAMSDAELREVMWDHGYDTL